MSHFGILCPPTPGHLNPLATLGRSLFRRGHRVTMFQLPDLRSRVEREGLEFWPLGRGHAEAGELAAAIERLGLLSGLSALRFTIRSAMRLAALVLDSAPAALREARIDLALIDQNEPAGATVAQYLGVPFVSVAAALPLNREPDVPPPFVMWPHQTSLWGRIRNRVGYAIADRLLAPFHHVLNAQRRNWRLPPLRTPDDSFSSLAQLSTMPETFDFPRRALPACFHYMGPFTDYARPPVPFPWERLDGKPLVYASFGTLQNRRQERFRTVAAACADLGVQLVLSSGGSEVALNGLRGSPVVVPYAPQLELLARSRIVVTHGGLNTVLEALSAGVPLLAIPIANDQPAVSSRVLHSGAGSVVPLRDLSAKRLRTSLEQVLGSESYRNRSLQFKYEIAQAGGVERAADLIEQALRTGTPVLRSNVLKRAERAHT